MWSSKLAGPALGGLGLILAGAAAAAVDLAAVRVLPQQGQSAERARRDRYECHQWAIEQSGRSPAAPNAAPVTAPTRGERAVAGAAAGAAIGGLIRSVQDKNPAHGMLAGAAIGAAVGAATARAEPPDDQAADPYLRALGACLEGRGYRVEWPGSGR